MLDFICTEFAWNFLFSFKAHLSRVKKSKEDEEEDAGPKYGAGSEYGRDRKEEAKKRRRVLTLPKETKKEDLPMTMRLGGKKGKW